MLWIAIETFDAGLKVGLETLANAEKNQSILRQVYAGNLSRAECLVLNGRFEEALAGKLAAVDFAVDEQKKWVARLEVAQLKVYFGEETKSDKLILQIPGALRATDGRIQLEMAFLHAAQMQYLPNDSSLPKDERIQRINDAKSSTLQRLQVASQNGEVTQDDFEWIKSHPFFQSLSEEELQAQFSATKAN